MAINDGEVDTYVRESLGETVLGPNSVEWSEATRKVCVKKTLRHFNRLVGLKRYGMIQTLDGVQRYVIDPTKSGQGIIDVQIPRISPGLQIDEFHILEQSFAPSVDVSSFLANRYGLEQLRNAIGSDLVWETRREDTTYQGQAVSNALVLYMSPPPRGSMKVAYAYIAELEAVSELPREWEQWCLDTILAEAKIIIGGARRRFESDLRQDGTILVQEGKDELEKLKAQAERGGLISGLVWKQM